MAVVLIEVLVMFGVFGLLARLSPCNPEQGRFISRDLPDNALWWMFGVLLYGDAAGAMIRAGAGLALGARGAAASTTIFAGYGWAARSPLWLQVVAILVVMDFIQYWLHRLFHGRTLWPFHAVHHSAEELEWTTTFRIHPLNFIVYGAGVLALTQLMGFSPAAFAVVAVFNQVIGALVHANLNWTWGPFRYVIASPVYHRWHHVKDPAIYNTNFAPNFPIWDLMFGTYYMPKGELPRDYGVEGAPTHFLASLVWPFREFVTRFVPPRKADAAAARP